MKKMIIGFMAVMATVVAQAAEQTVEVLNATFGVKDRVSFRADDKGEPIAVLKDANGTCEVMLRGAHVTACSFAGDKHPLLYVPRMGYVGKPYPRSFIHGGVPLLWPWFGASGAPVIPLEWWQKCLNFFGCSYQPIQGPFHATSRYSLFTVKNVSTANGETAITLLLTPCAEVAEFTPGNFELEYRITLGAHKLGLRLTTKNVGDEIFRYREGYHPYFAVSDCYALTLTGVDGYAYESNRDLPCDVTHVWKGPVPEWPGCDVFTCTEDRSAVTLADPLWKRDIILTTTGGHDLITWCQDVKGAKKGTMNILPEECRDYFCIEPSNYYPASEIALKKGESHTFETVITVRPHAAR